MPARSNNELQALDKQLLALQLRKAGASFEQVAKACGYANAGGAFKAVKTALKKTLQEPADDLRKLELARLDEAQAAIWAKVKNGDLKAIDRLLRISERRSKLLGLDAPVKLEGEVTHTVNLQELDAIRAQRWAEVQEAIIRSGVVIEGETIEDEAPAPPPELPEGKLPDVDTPSDDNDSTE